MWPFNKKDKITDLTSLYYQSNYNPFTTTVQNLQPQHNNQSLQAQQFFNTTIGSLSAYNNTPGFPPKYITNISLKIDKGYLIIGESYNEKHIKLSEISDLLKQFHMEKFNNVLDNFLKEDDKK